MIGIVCVAVGILHAARLVSSATGPNQAKTIRTARTLGQRAAAEEEGAVGRKTDNMTPAPGEVLGVRAIAGVATAVVSGVAIVITSGVAETGTKVAAVGDGNQTKTMIAGMMILSGIQTSTGQAQVGPALGVAVAIDKAINPRTRRGESLRSEATRTGEVMAASLPRVGAVSCSPPDAPEAQATATAGVDPGALALRVVSRTRATRPETTAPGCGTA